MDTISIHEVETSTTGDKKELRVVYEFLYERGKDITRQDFHDISQNIPHQPGCYRYYNTQGELLYVGKAKDQRKRVSSYFNKAVANYKTSRLVMDIARIEYTVTNTEHDAFLLENSLIKRYQPRFNIDLKDDKSYPFIVIKK